jgi:hypothetical protein
MEIEKLEKAKELQSKIGRNERYLIGLKEILTKGFYCEVGSHEKNRFSLSYRIEYCGSLAKKTIESEMEMINEANDKLKKDLKNL